MKTSDKTVVLLALNAKYVHSSLSVRTLAAAVSRYAQTRWRVDVIELTINQSNDEIISKVAACRPDVIGISTYIWNAAKLPGIVGLLRKTLPETIIVLGGPEASHNAEHWLAQGVYNVDFILRGECERSFPALLDMLAGARALDDASIQSIPGLCMMKDGAIIASEPKQLHPDDFTDPFCGDYFNALGGRIAYIETSRGCPFRCSFCLSGSENSCRNVRFLPVETVKTQLHRLSEADTRTIKLVDRTFNCNPSRAYEIFKFVIGLDTTCRFHFEAAPDLFDEDTLKLLQTAPPGRIQIEAGIQSFCKPSLEAVSRHTDLLKAESNIRALLRGKNIHVHIDLIAGLPYEALPDLKDSFNRAYSLQAHTLQLGFLKMLHGSSIREKAEYFGISYSKEPPYEIISSPWLSADDFAEIKHAENALQHTYNKGRFLSALRYSLEVSKYDPYSLYSVLGKACPNRGTPMDIYAEQIFNCIGELPGIDHDELKERFIYDWLAMAKGVNMPSFLKLPHTQHKQIAAAAENLLGRKIARCEAAVLPSCRYIFVDSKARDPVTGLYKVISPRT